MKRRQFIKLSSAASVMALSPLQVQAAFNTFMPFLDCPDASNRKLVLIFLNGGNDGLNTLVPVNQYDTYRGLRQSVYIPELEYINLDTGLSLGDQVGLHPSLSAFKGLYEDGLLRIIHNVGYPLANKSHFKSTDLYSTGNDGLSSGNGLQSGWMGRYFEGALPDFIEEGIHPPGIQMGTSTPSLGFQGANTNGLAMNLKGQRTRLDEFYNDLNGGLNGLSGVQAPNNLDEINSDYGNNLKFLANIDLASNKYAEAITNAYNNGGTNPNPVIYPDNIGGDDLPGQLSTVARLIRGGLQSKIYMVQLNGFDTHAGQVDGAGSITGGRHDKLLTDLSGSIKAFMEDIQSDSLHEDIVGLTFSEFGRKAGENGSLGTDHGQAAPMFIFGTPVAGGISGSNPDLSIPSAENNYQIEDLDYDYRQVFASLLQNFLGADNAVIDNAFLDYSSSPGTTQSFTNAKISELLKEEYDLANCSTFSDNNPSSIEKKWLLHPNPVKDVINFSTTIKNASSVSYKIYNTTGKLLMSKTNTLEFGQLNLSLKHLTSGLYFFQIKVDGSTEVHKVIKI